MQDLISREVAIKSIEEGTANVNGLCYLNSAIDILKTVPNVTARSLDTGTWITVGKTKHGSIIRKCSACGVEKAGSVKSRFCPDCGAAMGSTQECNGQTSLYD